MSITNNILLFIITVLNVLNIIIFRKHNILPTFITLGLLVLFFMVYNFDKLNIDKEAMFYSMVAISLLGPFIESIIIHFTDGEAWNYGRPLPGWYVPLWLLPGYGMLGLSCLHTYHSLLK